MVDCGIFVFLVHILDRGRLCCVVLCCVCGLVFACGAVGDWVDWGAWFDRVGGLGCLV